MVFADSTVQSSMTVETLERSVTGSSWSSNHALTQFDLPEPSTVESSAEISADIPVKVFVILSSNEPLTLRDVTRLGLGGL